MAIEAFELSELKQADNFPKHVIQGNLLPANTYLNKTHKENAPRNISGQ